MELPFLRCYNHGCARYAHNGVHFFRLTYNPNKSCGGWDSNPRIPTKQGPKPCAFDLAGLPPH